MLQIHSLQPNQTSAKTLPEDLLSRVVPGGLVVGLSFLALAHPPRVGHTFALDLDTDLVPLAALFEDWRRLGGGLRLAAATLLGVSGLVAASGVLVDFVDFNGAVRIFHHENAEALAASEFVAAELRAQAAALVVLARNEQEEVAAEVQRRAKIEAMRREILELRIPGPHVTGGETTNYRRIAQRYDIRWV